MFRKSVLSIATKALVALSLFSSEYGSMMVDAKASTNDIIDYPEIYKVFKIAGEKHDVYWKSYDCTTDDNYELTMFRIIGGKNQKKVYN